MIFFTKSSELREFLKDQYNILGILFILSSTWTPFKKRYSSMMWVRWYSIQIDVVFEMPKCPESKLTPYGKSRTWLNTWLVTKYVG